MKRLFTISVPLLFLFFASVVHAQTGWDIQLTWTASLDQCTSSCVPGTGPTLINVYRGEAPSGGTCAQAPSWARIATGVAPGGPYLDNPPSFGIWCYVVRAYFVSSPAFESGSSNIATVPLNPLSPPTGLTGVIQ